MTVTEKKDEHDVVVVVPDEELLQEAEKEDYDYSRAAKEAEERRQMPAPFTWAQCFAGYRSWYSRNAAWSVLTVNGVVSLIALNALFSILVVNGFASILCLNSVFSIASMNCAFCIGCEGTTFCIGEGFGY